VHLSGEVPSNSGYSPSHCDASWKPRCRLGRPRPDLVSCLMTRRHRWARVMRHRASAQVAVSSAWKVVSNRTRRCPTQCTDPVWTKPRGEGGRPTATHHPSWLLPSHFPGCSLAAHGHCRARNDMDATLSTSLSSTTTEVTARAQIARARLGLVLQRATTGYRLGCMQGGSHWSGRAVEPERARWHDPVLGRWLGWAHA